MISPALAGEARTILPPIDMSGQDTHIKDKYEMNDSVDLKKLKEDALKDDEPANHREQFLKVYKEENSLLKEDADDDLNQKDIKFRSEELDNDSNIKVMGINDRPDGSKPLI